MRCSEASQGVPQTDGGVCHYQRKKEMVDWAEETDDWNVTAGESL